MKQSRMVATDSIRPHPQASLVPAMRSSEWDDFYTDVAGHGIRIPIEVDGEGFILDGRHRHRAAIELAMKQVPVIDAPLNGDSPVLYMLKAAVLRRHLTDDQRAAIAVMWIEEHKLTPATQPRADKGTFAKPSSARSDDGKPEVGPTKTAATQLFKTSRTKVDKANYVKRRAPEKLQEVHDGSKKLAAAYREVKKSEEVQRIESATLPTGQYSVIVIDPPWKYDMRPDDVSHRARNPYQSMSVEELRAYPIPAADDSILWLWTTNALLPDAFGLMKAWGFEYKTCLTWVKDRLGLGDWLRGQTEHCLLGIRGRYVVKLTNQTTALVATRTEHSAKPDEFYHMLNELCPGTRIDIFARKTRDGWETWGAQLDDAE